MSKGSAPRPVDQEKYRDNYEQIFGKKKNDTPHKDTDGKASS